MKRIILFRFHTKPFVCANRLDLLNKYNPQVEIFGLYGGPEKNYPLIERSLRPHLKHIYCITGKIPFWKWKNGDLALKAWYEDFGRTISFDILHLIEWDLLFFDSLESIYKQIPEDGIGVASLVPVAEIEKDWVWINKEPFRTEFSKLLGYVKRTYGYHMDPYAIQGPGLCLPKKFLEIYSANNIPELCNDEIRIPLFSQVFGFSMYDARFCNKWPHRNKTETFHCQLFPEIHIKTIIKELENPSGRRVFHPFRRTLAINGCSRKPRMVVRVMEILAELLKKFIHIIREIFGMNRLS